MCGEQAIVVVRIVFPVGLFIGFETLDRRVNMDQRAIHIEAVVARQARRNRALNDGMEKGRCDAERIQTWTIVRQNCRIKNR